MAEIVGVRFKEVGKVYYFSPGENKIPVGGKVIVETAHGVEFGEVVIANKEVDDAEIIPPLKGIMRLATHRDALTFEANKKKEVEILRVFTQKIAEHKLSMKPIDIDCTFDGSKILFYFTAESRVDFRELVKDLASVYRTRIELRQIGVRDEAKMLGGLGVCGRGLCCSGFLGEFQPVSIKMAKEQSLSLNPTKISGTCGRLMCCLKYEQDTYEELMKITPGVGAYIDSPEGKGYVEEANLLTGKLKIRLDKNKEAPAVIIDRTDAKVLRQAQIKLERDEINALKGLED
ncbi:MAG: stage 0 sporulation family protein [Oscillospiraceae bacterium]|nr:stage 0 sporulation family protein [Oscillospiraceae bacterium]